MGSIRCNTANNTLFMDLRWHGHRLREYTMMQDTPANRKRLQKALDRIEAEIALGEFDYQKTFGKPLPAADGFDILAASPPSPAADTPRFADFANQWFAETEVSWRRSYRITQRGAIDKYLLPQFADRPLGSISKADILEFRASLTRTPKRGTETAISSRRVNAIMKPLRQILNEAADRFGFNSPFRNIKPLKVKRSDVQPFSIEEVQTMLKTIRADYRPYLTVRFFTGMRTGEVHGLKWKYIDFERRLILVRESIVLKEDEDLKTEGSMRDIQMSQVVFDALRQQQSMTSRVSEYVFCNSTGHPVDNQNFLNRVWAPLLRHLGYAHRRAYQTRHTAATLWLASGEAPEWIARQLGHTSTEMLFRVYSRYVPNLTRQDGSAMDRLLTLRLGQASTPETKAFKPRKPRGSAQLQALLEIEQPADTTAQDTRPTAVIHTFPQRRRAPGTAQGPP